MTVIDKNKILSTISTDNPTHILELGCGNHKQISNSIGIDMLDYEAVDIVGDVYSVLSQIPDKSISAVYSFHFFEHINDVTLLLEEISRILIDGGLLEVVVPHFSNPYFYSDYTHKIFYGLYSFSYLAIDNFFTRKTPTYQKDLKIEITNVKLGFKSSREFPVRYGIKKFILEQIFNSSIWMKEFYEENLCYIFPCYEIKFTLINNR
jgi:ubiquinone/menaquinone biosynthesis C-methylase UbiE